MAKNCSEKMEDFCVLIDKSGGFLALLDENGTPVNVGVVGITNISRKPSASERKTLGPKKHHENLTPNANDTRGKIGSQNDCPYFFDPRFANESFGLSKRMALHHIGEEEGDDEEEMGANLIDLWENGRLNGDYDRFARSQAGLSENVGNEKMGDDCFLRGTRSKCRISDPYGLYSSSSSSESSEEDEYPNSDSSRRLDYTRDEERAEELSKSFYRLDLSRARRANIPIQQPDPRLNSSGLLENAKVAFDKTTAEIIKKLGRGVDRQRRIIFVFLFGGFKRWAYLASKDRDLLVEKKIPSWEFPTFTIPSKFAPKNDIDADDAMKIFTNEMGLEYTPKLEAWRFVEWNESNLIFLANTEELGEIPPVSGEPYAQSRWVSWGKVKKYAERVVDLGRSKQLRLTPDTRNVIKRLIKAGQVRKEGQLNSGKSIEWTSDEVHLLLDGQRPLSSSSGSELTPTPTSNSWRFSKTPFHYARRTPFIPFLPIEFAAWARRMFPSTYVHISDRRVLENLPELEEIPEGAPPALITIRMNGLRAKHPLERDAGFDIVPDFVSGDFCWVRHAEYETPDIVLG